MQLARCFAAIVLACTAADAQNTPAAPARVPVAITHVTVIDVASGATQADRTVVVEGNRISAVGASGEVRAPAGARVVDGAGKFLIPGLWDMHVHAAQPFTAGVFMPALVANGVTGVREMFSTMPWVDSTRAQVRAGALVGPRIVASGHILDGKPAIWPGSVSVATADEATRAVDSLKRSGADFIKVYSRLSRDAYFAAAAEAKRLGIPFAGHVPTLVSAAEASDAGQKSVEHLTGVLSGCSSRGDEVRAQVAAAASSPKAWDSADAVSRQAAATMLATFDPARCRDLAARFVRNGTWMVPTIAVLHSTAYLDDTTLAADPRMRYVPKGFHAYWRPQNDFRFKMLTPAAWAGRKAIYARQLEIVRLLHDAGVQFLAGTDLSNPYVFPGFSLHDELASLVAAGFTPLEALQAATLAPARYLSATDSLGTIAPGKLADLVLLDANPLADIKNVSRIAAVVADGRFYDAAARERLLAQVATIASR